MKKTPFLMTLLLMACQVNPPTSQPQQSAAGVNLNPNRSGQQQAASWPDSNSQKFNQTEQLESASASVSSRSEGDALTLKVMIQRPPMQLQAFDLTRIKFIRALVKAPDLTQEIGNQDGFVAVQATQSSLHITGVPKGKNRLVTVQAYGNPLTPGGTPQLLDGVVLKALYSSVANTNEVEVRFSLQSTLAANVFEQLIQTQPTLAANLNTAQLSELVNSIATGVVTPTQNPFTGARVPPGRLDPSEIAGQIAADGQIPAIPAISIPPAWFYDLTSLSVKAQNPAATTYTESKIIIQVTDPLSQAVTLLPQSGNQVSFAELPPGNWEVIAGLQDTQGVIRAQERLNVSVPANGGSPVITNAAGQVQAGVVLTLPPLIQALQTEQGNPATSFNGGSTVIIRGDGFDMANPANNTVTIAGRQIPLANLPVTATSLAVVLPADLMGQNLPVVVTSNGKNSNSFNLNVIPTIVSLDRNSINGSLPAGDSGRQVVLTVAGFDPTLDPDLKLQFRNSVGNLLPDVSPLSKTSATITVNVPIAAATANIGVIRNEGAQALMSPLLTVVAAGPDITSTGHLASPGSKFTLTGTNFAPGNQPGGLPNTRVILAGVVLDSSAYRVVDTQTIEATVPAGFVSDQNYAVRVCVDLGTGSLGCDNETLMLKSAPSISGLSWSGGSQPIVLIGQGFIPGQTTVTIGGASVPAANLIVTATGVQINNPAADSAGKLIQITTPYGTVTTDLSLYQNLLNYIGNTTSTYLDGGVTRTADSVFHNVDVSLSDPHGITVDACDSVYVVGNNIRMIQRIGLNGNLFWSKPLQASTEDVGIAVDGYDGKSKVFVAATGANRIDVFSKETGEYIEALQTDGEAFLGPEGIEVSANGQYLYVSSNSSPNSAAYNPSNVIKVVRIHIGSSSKVKHVEFVAGGFQRQNPAFTDETISAARFHHLEGLGIDSQNNIYVAEADFRQIRKISPSTGKVSVLASFPAGFTIHEIRVEPDGNVIVPGELSQKIYRISPSGLVSTIAGTGATGLKPGNLHTGTFNTPVGVDFDSDGNLYIADQRWGVRKISRLLPRSGTQLCP